MKVTHFRHNEYKITETNSGDLFWQSHYGFGSYREGRCYTKGSILFFAPAENEDIGFLIGEFADSIKKLPIWTRTKYYCHHVSIFKCESGRRVSTEEMQSWTIRGKIRKNTMNHPRSNLDDSHDQGHLIELNQGSFRLGGYEIAVGGEGQLSWALPAGQDYVSEGDCFVLEDILFINPAREKKKLVKAIKNQSDKIAELPKWDQTTYYSQGADLIEYVSDIGAAEGPTSHPGARAYSKNIPWSQIYEKVSRGAKATIETLGTCLAVLIKAVANNGIWVSKMVYSGARRLLISLLDKIKAGRKK